MAKVKVTKVIDGVEKQITVNPKYAGTSKKPIKRESSARHYLVRHTIFRRNVPQTPKTETAGENL